MKNGTDFLLYVKDSNDVYQAIASSQHRGFSITRTMSPIDTSSKASKYATHLHGRLESTISLETLYVENDVGYALLKAAYDNSEDIIVRLYEDGAATKQATAGITSLGEAMPDMDNTICSIEMKVNGAWSNV